MKEDKKDEWSLFFSLFFWIHSLSFSSLENYKIESLNFINYQRDILQESSNSNLQKQHNDEYEKQILLDNFYQKNKLILESQYSNFLINEVYLQSEWMYKSFISLLKIDMRESEL